MKKCCSERLKSIRLQNGFTQNDIAEMLGICRSAYTYYETGKIMPSVETLFNLSTFYKIPVEYFLKGIPDIEFQGNKRPAKKITAIEEVKGLSREERRVIAIIRYRGTEFTEKLLMLLEQEEEIEEKASGL